MVKEYDSIPSVEREEFVKKFWQEKDPLFLTEYNERLLEKGAVIPYLIWPNINPFHSASSLVEAVLESGKAKEIAEKDSMLRKMRKWTRDARKSGHGIYEPVDPLKLLPFEVRFLARLVPPDRWVIDLGKSDAMLIRPQNYYRIANSEDRLFIPAEYVPLFIEKSWKREQ